MRASDGWEGMYKTRFSRIFKKVIFFERPQAEFQIDAIVRVYTICCSKQRGIWFIRINEGLNQWVRKMGWKNVLPYYFRALYYF
jgi:hypothetical protein